MNSREGNARYGSALQEKPCVGEPHLSLVHVKTVRREMVSAVGVYPKLSMSVALHKIYPPIFPFIINTVSYTHLTLPTILRV